MQEHIPPQSTPASELMQQPEHQVGHTVFEGSGLLDKMLEQTPAPVAPAQESDDPLVKNWHEAQSAFSPEQRKQLLAMKKHERKEDRLRHIRLMGLGSMIGGSLIDEHATPPKRHDR